MIDQAEVRLQRGAENVELGEEAAGDRNADQRQEEDGQGRGQDGERRPRPA